MIGMDRDEQAKMIQDCEERESMLAYVRFVAEKRPDLISTLDIVPAKLRPVVTGLGENFKADGIRVFQERSIRS